MPDEAMAPLAIVGNWVAHQVVSTVDRFPAWDEELLVESSRLEVAGTAGYLALAAQGLGIPPFVVSTVGNDASADFLRQGLASAGIDDAGVETIPGAETCLGIIFVGDRGQRGILTVLGAHEQMSVAVAERHDARIAACAEVFLCGNYLLPQFSPGLAVEYARRLRERGQVIVFDPSWDPGGWTAQSRGNLRPPGARGPLPAERARVVRPYRHLLLAGGCRRPGRTGRRGGGQARRARSRCVASASWNAPVSRSRPGTRLGRAMSSTWASFMGGGWAGRRIAACALPARRLAR